MPNRTETTTFVRRRSLRALALLAAPLVLGLLLHADTQRATLCGLEGPHCPVAAWAGPHACPGCGLTRSTALLLHGHVLAAFELHPGAFVVVVLCALGCLVHADILARGHRLPWHEVSLRTGRRLFAAGLLASSAVRFAL